MKQILTLVSALVAALFIIGCGGGGNDFGSPTVFRMPTKALIVTNGYVAGDLVVSARFITEDKIEIISAMHRYLGGDGYWVTTPSARSIFNRQATGEWTSSESSDLGMAYQISDTVVDKCLPTTICGWTFTPAPLVAGMETASVDRLGSPQAFLPILSHSSPSWCIGNFKPQWVVAMSEGGKVLAIGAQSNSRYTRPDGRIQLPMAVLEPN